MNQILAAGTRVTVQYKGQQVQGQITAKSTDWAADVWLLGMPETITVKLPWDKVEKNEYRCFIVEETTDLVTITEVEPRNSHPMNWSGSRETTREGAWAFAQARGKNTVFVGRDGSRKELGRVFDPRAFERAAYHGYVAYGHSMSDGYYAPIDFEAWVESLRKFPEHELNHQNDVPESVKAALPLYQQALASVGL